MDEPQCLNERRDAEELERNCHRGQEKRLKAADTAREKGQGPTGASSEPAVTKRPLKNLS